MFRSRIFYNFCLANNAIMSIIFINNEPQENPTKNNNKNKIKRPPI
jgi:hypothetical protein